MHLDFVPVLKGEQPQFTSNECFPVKPNTRGTYEYALWNDNEKTAEYQESGLIAIDGADYEVHADKVAINLVHQ